MKKTGVELELLTGIDMHLFVERGLRGGISMVSKRYAKANNPQVPGYDPSKPNKHIMYLDANNLYGWAMSKPLPTRDFKWKSVIPTEEAILKKKENAEKGWILEVDLEYPAELHEQHNSYPLAPEKKLVKREKMSEYQNRLIEDLELKPPDSKKLLLTLEDKNDYVVHYRNLQFYLKQGMKMKSVHRVLEFEQECWMEPYIRMNTEFRKKAKSDFEKNFYKLKKDLYDTSDYPKEHPLHSNTNKKVLGKMKDECAGTPIAEVVSETKNVLDPEGGRKKYQNSEGCEKERHQENNNARKVQGNTFQCEAAKARNEHSSK